MMRWIVLSLAFLCTGCGNRDLVPPYQQKELETLVDTAHFTIDWPLSEQSKQALKQWLQPYNRRTTHIRIQDKDASKTSKAWKACTLYLQSLGFDRTHIAQSPLIPGQTDLKTPAISEKQCLIAVDAYTIVPPACPDWSNPLGLKVIHQPHENFGCATILALGQMVSDPKDLIVPKSTLSPFDGTMAYNSIQSYHNNSIQQNQSISSSSSASQSLSNSSGGGTTSNSSSGSSSSGGSR